MLPRSDIVRWRAVAPWADDDDVEQDLVITLALFDIFGEPMLKDALAFRGGTALHKLHLAPAARYSVQRRLPADACVSSHASHWQGSRQWSDG